MDAKYIKMHEIINRTTLKLLPKDSYTVEYIAKRMYDCYAQVQTVNGQEVIKDVQHGVIANIIESKVDSGTWHQIEPVEFIKARFEVEPFYQEKILTKKT